MDPEVSLLALDFVIDLLGDKATADFFYTNDLHVLVDILIRHLTDYENSDLVRLFFLPSSSVISVF